VTEITVNWPAERNEHGRPMLWFGSWLVGADGGEGSWFYSGRGGARERYPVPANATGVRIRRWPNEGFEPEYADVFDPAPTAEIRAGDLDFDTRQQFSFLAEDFG
jgi:hypothetical protein